MQAARSLDRDGLWTLQQGFDQVIRDLEAGGARPATLAYYRNHWRIVTRVFDPAAMLHQLTPQDVRTYVETRMAAGISMQTIWGKELQVLERVLNLAVRRGVLAGNPMRDVRRPKLRATRRDDMPVERLTAVLERIRGWGGHVRTAQRDADIIALAFLTGCRRAELARLRTSDVDLALGQMFVEGKNANRYLPVAGELTAVLGRLLESAGADGVLVGSERKIEALFERWKLRLNEPLLVPRSLRHGFATDQASNGLSPFELQALMGHANLRQTQRYFHSQQASVRAAMRSAGERLAGRTPAAAPSDQDPPAAP